MTDGAIPAAWIAAASGVFGLIIGSFLNVCIWRLPRGESIAWPASRCPHCSRPIAWFDNIPILSFLILSGRCRACRSRIPFRYPLVEILGGVAALAAWARWGASHEAVIGAVIFFALIVVTFVDLDHWIIPDEISIPGIPLGLLVSLIWPAWIGGDNRTHAAILSLGGILAGGGVLWLIGTIAEKALGKEAMGGGDVKLLAAIGAFLGPMGVLVTLFAGSLSGAVAGIAFRLRSEEGKVPFGPFLAAGAVIYALWGGSLIRWYLSVVLK